MKRASAILGVILLLVVLTVGSVYGTVLSKTGWEYSCKKDGQQYTVKGITPQNYEDVLVVNSRCFPDKTVIITNTSPSSSPNGDLLSGTLGAKIIIEASKNGKRYTIQEEVIIPEGDQFIWTNDNPAFYTIVQVEYPFDSEGYVPFQVDYIGVK